MDEKLIEIITEAFNLPIRLQGSYKPKEKYPNHFFTYWNNNADGDSFYDNDESSILWVYDLNFYSIDAQLTQTKLLEAKAVLKAHGWIVTGAGYDVASDEATHTGRGITVSYRQKL